LIEILRICAYKTGKIKTSNRQLSYGRLYYKKSFWLFINFISKIHFYMSFVQKYEGGGRTEAPPFPPPGNWTIEGGSVEFFGFSFCYNYQGQKKCSFETHLVKFICRNNVGFKNLDLLWTVHSVSKNWKFLSYPSLEMLCGFCTLRGFQNFGPFLNSAPGFQKLKANY